MLTRMTAVLVLLAALLTPAPVVPAAFSLRWSAAIVTVRTERQHQRQLRQRIARQYPLITGFPALQYPPPPFPGFAHQNFQRPPPARG